LTYTTSDRVQLYWFLRQFRSRAIQDRDQQRNRVGLYFAQKKFSIIDLHLTMFTLVLKEVITLEREERAA